MVTLTLTSMVRSLRENVPEANRRVTGPTGQVFAVRTELDRYHCLSVARQRAAEPITGLSEL